MSQLTLLPDNERAQWTCSQLLGKPLKRGITGTKRLFVEQASIEQQPDLNFPMDKAQLSFQKYEKGLLLRFIYMNQTAIYPLPFDDIQAIKLSGGDENLEPIPYTPCWFLLKLGVPLTIARNFYGRRLPKDSEYTIEPTSLSIETEHGSLLLHTSSYDFSSIKEFFNSLDI